VPDHIAASIGALPPGTYDLETESVITEILAKYLKLTARNASSI
jgi:hypothetical protein